MRWLAVLPLTACGPVPVPLPPPPAALVAACDGPVALPGRDATQAEVVRWWAADRGRLVDCRGRHDALAAWASDVTEGR
jgi:hypothetical protein